MGKIKGGETPDYDAQYDADTLSRAADIKADKKRHKAAIKHAKRKITGLTRMVKDSTKPVTRVTPQDVASVMQGFSPRQP